MSTLGEEIRVISRVESLRERVVSKAYTGGEYRPEVRLCLERARFLTESYRNTEGQSPAIRRAKALEHILSNMTIFIADGELIVGYNASAPNRVPCWPEVALGALEEALTGKGRKYVDAEDLKELEEITEYWQHRSLRAYVESDHTLNSGEGKKMFNVARADCSVSSTSWISELTVAAPDLEFVLKYGLNGIINMIEHRMEEEEKRVPRSGPEYVKALKKFHEWEAMIIACRAVIKWAQRYSELASFMAECETNPKRKDELNKIAEVCNRVPANPPRNFWESLQCQWFLWLVTHCVESPGEGSPCRLDQLHWPYYEHDVLRNKVLSEEEAVELLALLRLKFNGTGRLATWALREALQGVAQISAVTIGGVKPDGSDAFNPLTEAILSSCLIARTAQPNVVLRYHQNMPERAKYLAWQCIKSGLGLPSFVNDEVHIDSVKNYGFSLEEARNWAIDGCCVSMTPIGNGLGVKANPSWILLPAKCLELALNKGVEIYPGSAVKLGEMPIGAQVVRLGPSTGDPVQFSSYEEMVEAFRKQLRYAFEVGQRMRDISRYYEARYFPAPFLSALYRGCIEQGTDGLAWEIIPQGQTTITGMIDAGDALVAIKKLVFDEKKHSMKELIDALKANWEGYEEMRQDLIKAPKWGNDNDYADMIIKRDAFELVAEEAAKIKDAFGASLKIVPQGVGYWWSKGKKTGALPNGRGAGEPFSDGGVSPVYGMDQKGPTAVIKSCSKLNHRMFKGVLLNQRLSPASLEGEKGFRLFYDYLDAWYMLSLDHVQFTVVDTATLRDAQQHPEKYSGLLVRVAGYSAYFTQLNKETQDYIIARTEQALA